MSAAKVVLVLFALSIAGVIAYYATRETPPEDVINARTEELIALVNKSREETQLQALSAEQKAVRYFMPQAQVRLLNRQESIVGRDNLLPLIHNLRQRAQRVRILIWERSVTVGSNEREARMNIALRIKADFSGEDGQETGDGVYIVDWVLDGTLWRISQVSRES